jgi:hypothetical protein
MGRRGVVVSLTKARAVKALEVAQALAQRVQIQRDRDGRETGNVFGHPAILRGLCAYLGAGKRNTSRWSVYLEPKYRLRLKVIRGSQPPVGPQELQ